MVRGFRQIPHFSQPRARLNKGGGLHTQHQALPSRISLRRNAAPTPGVPPLPNLDSIASREGLAFADHLGRLLRHIQFHRHFKMSFSGIEQDLFIDPFSEKTFELVLGAYKQQLEGRTLNEALFCLLFFHFGFEVGKRQFLTVFNREGEAFMRAGIRLGFFKERDQYISLNDFGITYKTFENQSPLFFLADPSMTFNPTGNRVHLDNNSVVCADYAVTIAGLKKNAVDIGSGSGIIAQALLQANPDLPKVIAFEDDERANNFCRVSARMNRVAINNLDQRLAIAEDVVSLDRELGGAVIELAFMNPPYTASCEGIVLPDAEAEKFGDIISRRPEGPGKMRVRIADHYGHFGYGGRDGLQVTLPLLDIALPRLAADGRAIVYSVFLGTHNRCKLGDLFQTRGHRVVFQPLDEEMFNVPIARFIERSIENIVDLGDGDMEETIAVLRRELTDTFQSQGFTHAHSGFLGIFPKPKT